MKPDREVPLPTGIAIALHLCITEDEELSDPSLEHNWVLLDQAVHRVAGHEPKEVLIRRQLSSTDGPRSGAVTHHSSGCPLKPRRCVLDE
jgi:hypothetical protein